MPNADDSPLRSAEAHRFTVIPNPNPLSDQARQAELANPAFGVVFTDHMSHITWTPDAGWHDFRVEPMAPLSLHPAAAVLHYAQEIFEGLKAYRHADGSIWTFRPWANAERMRRSARRMALPELPEEDFLASIEALVQADREWVPGQAETSLYLRPFMFGSEAFLGVRGAHRVEYYVIASPAGSYFAGGFKPVTIWVPKEYHRAAPGGTGDAKTGGNYAASLLAQNEAYAHGCDQVLFLDAVAGTCVEELGGMNIFVVYADGSVATPTLTGTILEGVTRSSIIQLIQDRGQVVTEQRLALNDILSGIMTGQVTEVFACGTAAVVTPVGQLLGDGIDATVAGGQPGPLTLALRQELTDIQYGRLPDRHGWLSRLV